MRNKKEKISKDESGAPESPEIVLTLEEQKLVDGIMQAIQEAKVALEESNALMEAIKAERERRKGKTLETSQTPLVEKPTEEIRTPETAIMSEVIENVNQAYEENGKPKLEEKTLEEIEKNFDWSNPRIYTIKEDGINFREERGKVNIEIKEGTISIVIRQDKVGWISSRPPKLINNRFTRFFNETILRNTGKYIERTDPTWRTWDVYPWGEANKNQIIEALGFREEFEKFIKEYPYTGFQDKADALLYAEKARIALLELKEEIEKEKKEPPVIQEETQQKDEQGIEPALEPEIIEEEPDSRIDEETIAKENNIIDREVWEVPISEHFGIIKISDLEQYEKIGSMQELDALGDEEDLTHFGMSGGSSWEKAGNLKRNYTYRKQIERDMELGLLRKGKIPYDSVVRKSTREDIEKANNEGKYVEAVTSGRMTLEKAISVMESANITPSEEFIKMKKEMRGVKEGASIIGKFYDLQGNLRRPGMFAVDEPVIEGEIPKIKEIGAYDVIDECTDEKGRTWKTGETVIYEDGPNRYKVDRIIGIEKHGENFYAYLLKKNEGDIDHRPRNTSGFEKFDNKQKLIETIENCLGYKAYKSWIEEGKMTKEDAKKIIEGAGFELPEYLKENEQKS